MSDHKPIAAPLVPSPPAKDGGGSSERRRCLGCQGPEHGSVGMGIACLETALVQARQEILRLKGVLP